MVTYLRSGSKVSVTGEILYPWLLSNLLVDTVHIDRDCYLECSLGVITFC